MEQKRTKAQQAVIDNRGGGLLVSAAAGAGKTSVLVDRLLDRITQEGLRIDEFLIITFTKAAAGELKGRIARALADRRREDPENRHLQQQSILLFQTQISTIHALCTSILREWGHMIDLPTDFTLCEEQDAGILMTQTLNEVLEKRYEEVTEGSNFAKLLDILSAGRDDGRLMEIALDIFARTQSHPDPKTWMEEQKRLLSVEGIAQVEETVWGQLLLADAKKTVCYWIEELGRAAALTQAEESLAPYGESLGLTVQSLEEYEAAICSGWDAAADFTPSFPRLKPVRNCTNPALQDQVKQMRSNCKEAMEALGIRFESDSATLLGDLQLLYPAMESLLDLVLEFSEAYQAAKARRGILDFSDLEHQTVALLQEQDGTPTELARQLRRRYAEIMVDEYQDTNQVQNAIFSALSDDGKNLFLVGDVKQSIYRFRLADPAIFLGKYRQFPSYEIAKEGQERKIILSQNFRSRPEVLESVNDLFRVIMSEQLGEMNYTDAEALYPGGTFPNGEGYETELHVLDFKELTEQETTGQKPGNHELEARFVAKQIAGLLEEGFLISDGAGGKRPISPEDFAILLRAPGSVRQFYSAALNALELPWSAEDDSNFFATTEVSTLVSFLQVIDNPRQDVPLISVLHSPLYGFDGERLAQIRLSASEGDFYTALRTAAEMGEEDCGAFLSQLEQLRFEAGEMSCHELIWKLFEITGAIELFRRMPGGERREENLLALYETACRFEENGHRGLFGFLLHLNRLQENGVSFSKGNVPEQLGVKILSIHRSKGLEYPVVFLCGMGKRFNLNDMQKPVLFHPGLGLGPRGLDPEQMVEFSTLPRQAVALQLKKELLAEEMRLLYVAMTRAKEKLIMTHALSYGESDLKKLAPYLARPLNSNVLMSCSSVGQWVLLAAMTRPEGEGLRQIVDTQRLLPEEAMPFTWRIQYHKGVPDEGLPSRRQTGQEDAKPSVFSREELWQRLQWRYPYEQLASIPAKLTATQLGEAWMPAEPRMPEMALLAQRSKTAAFRRPRFAAEELGLTAAQKGTAFHIVMQSIRLEKTNTLEEIQEELQHMQAQAYLTSQEAAAVPSEKVYRFFNTPLGKEVKQAASLYREFPFSVLVPAQHYYDRLPAGEQLLLQGMIDCWFDTSEGITVVDFKTGWVSEGEVEAAAEPYYSQMRAYTFALEEITGRPVTRRILWFLTPNCGVELDGKLGVKKIEG